MTIELPAKGLDGSEVSARRSQFGLNSLPARQPISLWVRFARQFLSPLIFILLAALLVDAGAWYFEGMHGWPLESLAIGLILVINAALGVFQEQKSESALMRLQKMATPFAWVYRDGQLTQVRIEELVPGDLVRVEAGGRVPADGQFLNAEGVQIDESVLTGESMPVDKSRNDLAASGTQIVRGKGLLQITAIGPESAMGRLANLIARTAIEPTPLEKRLANFSRKLAYVVLALVVLLAVGGMVVEGWGQVGHVFLFAVALAVAAIPEGLPAVLTMTLAIGVERMAHRKAVVRRLSAVESLGSVTVIATDKTGTLTENKMFVKDLLSPSPELAIRAMVLANDADPNSEAGDPLELALLDFARQRGESIESWLQESVRVASIPFESSLKYMQVTVLDRDSESTYLKGAPEAVLPLTQTSEDEKKQWTALAEKHAREGHRVLAIAGSAPEHPTRIEFLGLVLLWDPPRKEVPEAIRRCLDSGIRIVLITGDHPATAMAVAQVVGISSDRAVTGAELSAMNPDQVREAVAKVNVFARVSPEHKVLLVEMLQEAGQIVAMTGDGVNDAPALKRSDVGVAMGLRGSDVTREVADLVLLDDNFATIVAAIEEGRGIYENIQKFIRFLFATNLAELLIIVGGALGAFLLGLKEFGGTILLPFTAVQLLWINILTDGPPALALGLDRNAGAMGFRPRDPSSPLLDWFSLRFILVTGCLVSLIAGLALVLLPQWGYDLLETRTAIFLYATIAQLFFCYPARRSPGANPMFNLWLHAAIACGIGLQVLTVSLPGLRELLGLTSVSWGLWAIVIAMVSLAIAFMELYFLWNRRSTIST